ncbi:alpha-glucosidase/alpha-galactosidase [Acidaminobacter sp. JC074]|uniref:family 4 glycosyl hydrolase n=1 Tax=Acidaminobacter sp. JC074 TaxID=2530199 RepID=UPI001F1078F0|nr:alpha-glucosidase/alpha-galactosidase [Acidaminobacter sp. JC074]MCH4887008.1 alpha-glucosidase/alpha-galactosidase [Acidaminobacter sp. JC074]
MNFKKDKVYDLNIAYIGGGSQGWAWGLMSDLALEPSLNGRVRLYDIDHKAAENNAIIGNELNKRDDVKSQWHYVKSDSLKDALTGADFVVISILPGTFDEMDSDVHTPEDYGIYQSVGDTVGPGGIIRALRTLPMYEEIALAIKEYSKDAWVINFTNPMTLCTRMLYKTFPEIKAFGNCHEVFGTQKLLISALKDICDIDDVKREEIKVDVVGINHFTWVTKATYKGMDLFPIYEQFVDKYYETGFVKEGDDNWMNNAFASGQRVKFELFKQYGYIAAAGDRHLAEACKGSWFLKSPDRVKDYTFGLTKVDYRKEKQKNLREKGLRLRNLEEQFEIKETGEEAVQQMRGILGLRDFVTNTNLPNKGQFSNLPKDVVVETNALFRRDRVMPITMGDMPMSLLGLTMPHVTNQELVIEAVTERDLKKAFRAFINDPNMKLDLHEARQLFNKMVKNTEKYLPDYFKNVEV